MLTATRVREYFREWERSTKADSKSCTALGNIRSVNFCQANGLGNAAIEEQHMEVNRPRDNIWTITF